MLKPNSGHRQALYRRLNLAEGWIPLTGPHNHAPSLSPCESGFMETVAFMATKSEAVKRLCVLKGCDGGKPKIPLPRTVTTSTICIIIIVGIITITIMEKGGPWIPFPWVLSRRPYRLSTLERRHRALSRHSSFARQKKKGMSCPRRQRCGQRLAATPLFGSGALNSLIPRSRGSGEWPAAVGACARRCCWGLPPRCAC